MAKTTKPAPKRTTSSSSKKQGFLKRSFNLKSRKVQFFVVILIVAILGGGYFTYKSFAATASWTYDRTTNTLSANTWNGVCQVFPFNEPSKNNKPVWSITCPYNNTKTSQARVAVTSTFNNYKKGKFYRVCAFVKGKANEIQINSSVDNYPDYIYNFNSDQYAYICGSQKKVYNTKINPSNTGLSIATLAVSRSDHKGGGWINISSIVIEEL